MAFCYHHSRLHHPEAEKISAAGAIQPGEGVEMPGAPSPASVSARFTSKPQTFVFTLDHRNRFTAITS